MFNGKLAAKTKKMMPDVETRLLVGNNRDDSGRLNPSASQIIAKIKKLGLDSIGPEWAMLDEEFVQLLKNAGLTIHPWTVDKPAIVRKLIKMKVDSITSNRARFLSDRI